MFWRTYNKLQMLSQNDSLTESPPTTTESEFYLNGRRLNLSTSCSVAMRAQSQNGRIEFVNFPCEVGENQLRKCYKIMLFDAFISVEDKITLDSSYRNFQKQQIKNLSTHNTSYLKSQRSKRKNKKMVLFKNRALRNTLPTTRNDKKNIAKNIVNAFLKFMRDTHSQDDANARNVLQSVSQLIKTLKFNNQLISAIIEQVNAREYFRQFLMNNAMGWLQHSKIKTKEIYDQAIKIYEKLCDDRERQIHHQSKVSPPVKDSSNSDGSICFRQLQNYELEEEIRGFK